MLRLAVHTALRSPNNGGQNRPRERARLERLDPRPLGLGLSPEVLKHSTCRRLLMPRGPLTRRHLPEYRAPLQGSSIRLSPGFQSLQKSCSCSSSLSILLIVWQVQSPLMLRLAAHAALRSPNQWRPKSRTRTRTRTRTIEEVETLNSTALVRDEKNPKHALSSCHSTLG
jgi:hypothetical protein